MFFISPTFPLIKLTLFQGSQLKINTSVKRHDTEQATVGNTFQSWSKIPAEKKFQRLIKSTATCLKSEWLKKRNPIRLIYQAIFQNTGTSETIINAHKNRWETIVIPYFRILDISADVSKFLDSRTQN